MANNVNASFGLAYTGVNSPNPPNVTYQKRQPTVKDWRDYAIGDLWLMITEQEIWMLISKTGRQGTWIQLYPGGGSGGADAFPTDAGTANQAGSELNIFGGTNINTAGSGNTVTVNLDDNVSLSGTLTVDGNIQGFGIWHTTQNILTDSDVEAVGQVEAGQGLTVLAGGIDSTGTTQLNDLTAGVMQTDATGVVSSDNGTNGQVLIGGGTAPAWANITSTGGSLTVTNGANTINIEQAGGPTADISFLAHYINRETLFSSTDASGLKEPGSVAPPTTIFNNGSGYFPGDGAGTGMSFTAPVDGVYHFSVLFALATSTTNLALVRPTTPLNTIHPSFLYRGSTLTAQNTSTSGKTYSPILAELEVGDIVTFPIQFIRVMSGSSLFIRESTSGSQQSWIYGHIVT